MTDFLKITKSIVVHFAHICAYGVETVKNTFKHGVYLMKQSHVEKSDILLLQFCKKFEILYGKEKCTPNMHNMHCHLKYSILDVGPLYSFWCFR